jgi:cardiolipin synthase
VERAAQKRDRSDQTSTDEILSDNQRALARVARRLGGVAACSGNSVEYLTRAADFERRLIEGIDGAKHHVHLVYFIFEDDSTGRRIADALERAAKRGVKVRLLADAAGSWSLFDELADRMRRAGIDVRDHLAVNPMRRRLIRFDLRNHRKLTVIDGEIAITGSHNIVDPTAGLSKRLIKRGAEWLDVSAVVRGPAVAQLAGVFLDDWRFETGAEPEIEGYLHDAAHAGDAIVQTLSSGPGADHAAMRDVVIEALHGAKERAVITTPYFVPDEPLMTALRLASMRGVRTELVVPSRSDKKICDIVARGFHDELLEAGVRVYKHRNGILHSKTVTVDDSFALAGSANMDMRSFFLNFELGVVMYDTESVRRLKECQEAYIADSRPLDRQLMLRRGLIERLSEGVARLVAPLL